MLSINPPTGKWTTEAFVRDYITLTWEAAMDTTATPPNASWTTTAAGFPHAVLDQTWQDATHLVLDYHVDDLSDPVYLTYAGNDPGLKTAGGDIVEPFGPILVPDPPWWVQGIAEWINDHPPPPLEDPEHPAWAVLFRVFQRWLERQNEP